MRRRLVRVPSYRPHSSRQARSTLDGQDHLLGEYGSPESHQAYRRLTAEWLAAKDRPKGQRTESKTALISQPWSPNICAVVPNSGQTVPGPG
jgi:hypothetical protein